MAEKRAYVPTERWTQAAKLTEYRRATWRLRVLDEATRYDDPPLAVLACRQPALGTPEELGHHDAEEAHRHWTADMLAEVAEIPDCDFHKLSGESGIPAAYDGETTRGPWAFMCSHCFREHGVGLGLGRGQRLALRGDPLVRQIGTVGNPTSASDEEAPLAVVNHPTRRPGEVMNRIRKARQRVAEFYAKTAAAQPGEVWTTSYAGPDFRRNYFESYTAGTVRVLGEECPVVEYRGRKTLGEADLDPETSWPWSWIGRAYLVCSALRGASRSLDPGDVAPDMSDSAGTGGFLDELPNRALVTVEWREPHPVYAGQRNVTVGYAYDHDERGGETGRDVGGDWIAFGKVTAVICHSHAEVAS